MILDKKLFSKHMPLLMIHYKKMSFDLNYKLKEHEVLRELPPEIVKHYEEIETLREKLGNFLVVMKP